MLMLLNVEMLQHFTFHTKIEAAKPVPEAMVSERGNMMYEWRRQTTLEPEGNFSIQWNQLSEMYEIIWGRDSASHYMTKQ